MKTRPKKTIKDQQSMTQPSIIKKEWVQKYANLIYESWHRWQGPLGVASDYIEQIMTDLEEVYPNRLKRALIEESYPLNISA